MKLSTLFLLCTGAAGVVFGDAPKAFVEYVEANDQLTYINTGVTVNPKRTRMLVTLAMNSVKEGDVAVFGRGNSWGNANSAFVLMQSGKFRLDYLGNQATKIDCTADTIYTFDLCNNMGMVNGVSYSTTAGKTDGDSNQAAYLFNFNNNGSLHTGAKMKLYAAAIWKDGEKLSGRYVPCIDDSDQPAVYDLVTQTIIYPLSKKTDADPALMAAATPNADYRVSDGKVQCRVLLSVSAKGGKVNSPAEQWVDLNSTVTLTATPDAGNKAVWMVKDECGNTTMSSGNTLQYEVTPVRASISVSFAPESAVATAAELYAAIEAAEEGDTIYMSAGEFVLTKTLVLNKNVKIVGAGADKTVIKMPAMAKFLSVDINHEDALLDGVALTGIYFTAKPTVAADDGCYNQYGQWQSPICVKVQKGTFKDSVIRDNYATLQYGTGPWLYMTGGRAENVKILDNYYNRTGNTVFGYAVYMKGDAVMENCEIARNGCPGEESGCVYMIDSAQLLHCDVHDNDGKAANYHGGIYMFSANVLVDGCRVYGNNNGVYLGSGTLRNSLIYANRTKLVANDAACYYAGVRQASGTMQNCTIYGNVSPGDASGVGGLHMTGGTAENNIIYGNGGVLVTGGAFNNNLTDVAVERGSDNIVGNPAFVDAANGDFRLGVGSLALSAGKAIASVTNDFAGVERPQGAAYDIGAYERPAATELACGIAVSQTDWKLGAEPTVSAKVEGTADDVTYRWFVDGAEIADTSATPSLGALAAGSHAVKLVVTAGGQSVEFTMADAVNVQPIETYVSTEGSDTFPYDTADKAARSVADALAAVYKGADEPGTVHVAAGTYYLDGTLVVNQPVTIVGAGRDATTISGGKMTDTFMRGMNLGNAAATVKDLSLVGCTNVVRGTGMYMSAGTLANVRVAWHRQNPNGNDERWGAGLYLTGGTVTNSVLERNYFEASYHGTRGGGVYMTGGLVVDCDICHNWMARWQHNGLGVCMSGGTVRGCRIFNNYSTANGVGGSGAGNCASGHGINMSGANSVVENCLIYSNGWNGVMMTGGTLRNCAVFGHRQCTADYFAGVNITQGLMVNCTITDNSAAGDSNGKSGLWQTGGTVVNTIVYNNGKPELGSCQVSGGTFKTNITDKVGSEGGYVMDPKFADPEHNDYHLLTGSPAVDKAAPLVAYDLEGTVRPQRDGWDIGCYELLPSTEKSVTIASDVVEGATGMEISATAKLENITGDIVYRWTLKNAAGETVKSGDGATFSYTVMTAGGYSLELEVESDGVTYAATEAQPYTVKPAEVFVSLNGSDTEPYDTPEKATTNVNAALAALWQSEYATSVLHIAEGTYYLTDQLMLSTPVRVLGEGRDVTVLNGSRIPVMTRGLTMTHADAVVRDLTLAGITNDLYGVGSAVRQEKGLLANVRITKTMINNLGHLGSIPAQAGSLYLSGGVATNLFIDGATTANSYGSTRGLGAYITGGLLTDSIVCSNGLNRGECFGHGVYMQGGTLRRTKIFDCAAAIAYDTRGAGLALHSDGGGNPVAEDVEVCGCTHAVYMNKGELRNVLVTGGWTTLDDFAGGLTMEGGTAVNCTLAGSTNSAKDQQGDLKMTSGTLVNSIAVSATVTGGVQRNNCLNEPVAFKPDYRLRGSAANCIDKGDNSVWDGIAEPTDLRGNPRIDRINKTVDLGCFEWLPVGFKLFVR